MTWQRRPRRRPMLMTGQRRSSRALLLQRLRLRRWVMTRPALMVVTWQRGAACRRWRGRELLPRHQAARTTTRSGRGAPQQPHCQPRWTVLQWLLCLLRLRLRLLMLLRVLRRRGWRRWRRGLLRARRRLAPWQLPRRLRLLLLAAPRLRAPLRRASRRAPPCRHALPHRRPQWQRQWPCPWLRRLRRCLLRRASTTTTCSADSAACRAAHAPDCNAHTTHARRRASRGG